MKITSALPFLFGFLLLGAMTGAHQARHRADAAPASAAPVPPLPMPHQLSADAPAVTDIVPLPAYVPDRGGVHAWAI
ncbi:MAG: hypothetical protein JOY51_06700 [Nevskia sp.]|nr:hypothetical protein [Nevskia sp.]